LALMLFDSLHNKLVKLPDDTRVYPAHGAGSSCGRALEDVEFTTIGEQKETNYALQPMTKEEFISQVVDNQPIPPKYFKMSATLNRDGLKDIDEILLKYQALDIDEFKKYVEDQKIAILDVRDPNQFAMKHIPRSYNIGLDGRYAEWVGGIIEFNQPILIVADVGNEREAAIRSMRVGFDNLVGYLLGGFETWENENLPTNSFKRIHVTEFGEYIKNKGKLKIIDVRKKSEYKVAHLPYVENIPLQILKENLSKFNKSDEILIHCAGGYRSVIASSILLNEGFTRIVDLAEGFDGLIKISEKQNNNMLIIS